MLLVRISQYDPLASKWQSFWTITAICIWDVLIKKKCSMIDNSIILIPIFRFILDIDENDQKISIVVYQWIIKKQSNYGNSII